MTRIICSCAQVVCGGSHCPVETAIQQLIAEQGRPLDPARLCDCEAVSNRFYENTADLYQQNCAFREEPRRKCCRSAVHAEFRFIHASGNCQMAENAEA